MKVLLVDIDSKIPNLALMKIAAYHKARGDTVSFNEPDPGKVYASVIFTRNRHKVDGLRTFYPEAEIDIGGSGYDLQKQLPPEIEAMSPDYSIYEKCDRYLGFTTRGCIRRCPFCVVPKKEGKFRRLFRTAEEALEHITAGASFRRIEFLDNNILADKAWFMELTEAIPKDWQVDFNQGLDVRLLDADIAERLASMRPMTVWKFAFDSVAYTDAVMRGIDTLRAAGIDTKHKAMFYVYTDNDAQYNDAVARCRALKDHGTTAYVMLNQETKHTRRLKDLQRWCCRPYIFWSIDIDEYRGASA